MVRLQIVLDPAEADALAAWAESELRDPRDQIRLVVRRELERQGLLDANHEALKGEEGAVQADHHGAGSDSSAWATGARETGGP
jgi:hypothetical protein